MEKTAFISGASRGIGRQIAYRLAKENYNLALCCVNNIDTLKLIAEDIMRQYDVKATACVLDVSNESEWQKQSSKIIQEHKKIDVVINNAAISYTGLITDMSYSEWDEIVATNLSSLFYSTKAFLPDMIHRKSGHIINISSMWGRLGASCEVAYSATKGGVDSYTKALAKEVALSNISVNAIACGVIDTDMNKHLTSEEREALRGEISVGRFGHAYEVSDMVVSILNAPSYMTGQIIGLDGGI